MSPKTEDLFAVCHFDSAARAQQAIGELQQIGIASSAVQTITGDGLSSKSSSDVNQQFLKAGVHEDDATYLSQELREKGGVLAIVRTNATNESKVDEIFARYGAHETDAYESSKGLTSKVGDKLQAIEEELVVGKRAVSRGGMRIYSRLIETPVEQDVTLSEETIRVERVKVDRPISSTAIDALGREQMIEMKATGEEAVVGKTARVVEEVSLGKEASSRTETVRDSVRKTKIEIEQIDPEVSKSFQSDYKTKYGTTGEQFDTYAPAYAYGYSRANDPQYKGKSYNDVETDLRSEYETENPGGTWDKFKGAVQTGWNKVTGN